MKSAMYMIGPNDVITTDGLGVFGRLLHDVPADAEKMHLRALVASGDYFATLAACLEQIAAALPETSAEQFQLQGAVGQLLTLQHDYVITKRSTSTRP